MPPKKTRGTERTTPTKRYICLPVEGRDDYRGFDYPVSRSVRDRIRAGERIPRTELGELKRHTIGDTLTNPPADLIESWLRRGIVELAGAAKKEATDDSPK